MRKTYNVKPKKSLYYQGRKCNYCRRRRKTKLDIALEEECKVTIGDDLGKCFGIKIYTDFDKSNIRVEAAIDLENIGCHESISKMKLDIRSHTDSRGSFKYNESLSDRRAQSTIAWLIENGVDKGRLTLKDMEKPT
jgi:peptidoglycan-associated lipoprotein